jgi:multidrug efflux pump subunit AcrA (membrane-fusion protein)
MSAGATTPPSPPSEERHDEHRRRRPGRRLLWILVVAAVLAVALLVGWLPHQKRNKQVDAKAKQQQNSVPVVEVQIVHGGSAAQDLALPGTVTPLKSAHIYARASGFLKARYVDLGDTVRKGQLLGLISLISLFSSNWSCSLFRASCPCAENSLFIMSTAFVP